MHLVMANCPAEFVRRMTLQRIQLPFSFIVEEYKVARMRDQGVLDESVDNTFEQAKVQLNQR